MEKRNQTVTKELWKRSSSVCNEVGANSDEKYFQDMQVAHLRKKLVVLVDFSRSILIDNIPC